MNKQFDLKEKKVERQQTKIIILNSSLLTKSQLV